MDDGGSGTNDDRNRLAEVERQLAELRAEVEQLREDVRRLSGGTGEMPDRGPQRSADAQPNVVLTAFVSVAGRPRRAESGSGIVVPLKSTVVVTAPAELWREWETGVPPPGPLGDLACRLLDEVQEGVLEGVRKGVPEWLAERFAQIAIDPVWEPASRDWHVTDIGGFEAAARSFSDLDTWSHSAVASWVTDVGNAIGMPGAMANGAGAVIGLAVPLPFDQPLKELSQVIQVAGVAFGIVTGNAPLACASLKALAHDQLIDLVAREVRGVTSVKLFKPGHASPRRPDRPAPVVMPEEPVRPPREPDLPDHVVMPEEPVRPPRGPARPAPVVRPEEPVRSPLEPARPAAAMPEEPVRPPEPASPEEVEKTEPSNLRFGL
jgi:hypothetical protein